MNNPKRLAEGLVDELLAVVHKYDECMILATALGCLDVVKAQLVQDHMEGDEE
jgi:hypothetical protein